MSRRGDSAVGHCRLVISEPKTTHRRREVPLHATTVAMLRKHRIAQMEERMEAANVWIDEGLVFTTETGGKIDPRNFLQVPATRWRSRMRSSRATTPIPSAHSTSCAGEW